MRGASVFACARVPDRSSRTTGARCCPVTRVFAAKQQGGFMRVPMRSRIGLQTASATAYSRVEGASVPATRFVLDNALLSPTSIAALLVASDVVLRDVGAAGQEFFNNALRAAIGVEADEF